MSVMPDPGAPGASEGRPARGSAAGNGLGAQLSFFAGDFFAGGIVAALNIALAVSFAALIFQGDLKGGLSVGLWSLLMSMVVIGGVVALTTSIPPIAAGPDTPVVAVMPLLAAAVSSQISALGGSAEQAVRHTMLAFSLMTVMSGTILYLIGALNLGQLLRFVPYPVVGGFLAATGWLLIVSSYKMITGAPLTIGNIAQTLVPATLPKIAVAGVFAVGLLLARQRIKAPYLLPAAFFGVAAGIDLFLWRLGGAADYASWYIGGIQNLRPWFPIAAALSPDINWIVLLKASPEMLTCVIVGIISLVVKVSGIETLRSVAADFNQEFRANGSASLVAAPLGGLAGSLLVNSSKAFKDAGARTRFSGVVAGGFIALVVFAGVNLPGLVPRPVLAGLVVLLGYNMLMDALRGAFNQQSWWEFALALAIAVICLRFGYIAGVLVGFVCACLIFAFSYSRIGVVRWQLTRASFSSDVVRAPVLERLLREEGDAIQVYWLSGYIFFGSSEGLFERVRGAVESQTKRPVRFVLLNFAGVTGIDSSAIMSLVKLRNFCDKRGVTLVYSGLAVPVQAAFERASLFGKDKRHRTFATRNEALDWSEEQLLSQVRPADREEAPADFERWLSSELGCAIPPELVADSFNRKEFKGGEILYRQGDPADTIDFVASGTLAIMLDDGRTPPLRLRRMTRQTVLGEMGFFRNARRTATIAAEGPAVIYSLDRPALERMQRDHAETYEAFLCFVVRTLSDRLELANREVAALT